MFILGASITVRATTAPTAALAGRDVTIDAAISRTLAHGVQVLAGRPNDMTAGHDRATMAHRWHIRRRRSPSGAIR